VGLRLRGEAAVPSHVGVGGFDHGDVHLATGRVFLAHTANDCVEVLDGPRLVHLATIEGTPEASGILCSADGMHVIAAARGGGHVNIIDPNDLSVERTISVGGRPNGLAWDSRRGRVLVADVAGDRVSIVDPLGGQIVAGAALPGRPRWAVYDDRLDRYLVNVRVPALVAAIDPERGRVSDTFAILSAGPHGLDLDRRGGRAFVACDGSEVVVIDTRSGAERGRVEIGGAPDAIWFNDATQELFVAIGDPGLLQVVDTQTLAVEETVHVGLGTQTTALDSVRQQLYVFRPSTCDVAAYQID
jgi:DNA-binding beta-propeller fold protein YncE